MAARPHRGLCNCEGCGDWAAENWGKQVTRSAPAPERDRNAEAWASLDRAEAARDRERRYR